MRRTSLFETHRKLGARFTGFAGWEMPLSYLGAPDEHRVVREKVGLFDISHMGRIEISGADSGPLLQMLTSRDVERIPPGTAQYTLLLNHSGGIIDDIVLLRRERNRFLLCMNAINSDKDIDWIRKEGRGFNFAIKDITEASTMLALQGPRSRSVLQKAAPSGINKIKPRCIEEIRFGDIIATISMTGYTGEIGYEIIVNSQGSQWVWDRLMDAGKEYGIQPCGLGARDTLRLEMSYLLYGNDIDEATTPIEACLEWVVDFSKDDFIGKAALLEQKKNGPKRRLIFFELLQKGVPRRDFRIFSDGKEIGVVTSGNISPMLNKGIGIGYVMPEYAKAGVEVLIDIRGRVVPANIVQRPFYVRK